MSRILLLDMLILYEPHHEKTRFFSFAKIKIHVVQFLFYLILKFQDSKFSSVSVSAAIPMRIWSETPKTCFLASQLIYEEVMKTLC